MLIDCFMINNELDMLESRLNFLNQHVDHFVIVEGDTTHSGNKKELNFELNKSRFEKFLNKITYLPYVNINRPFHDHWTFEAKQRDYISIGLEKFSPDDFVIVSDLDEIPNPEIFDSVKQFLGTGDNLVARLEQLCFLYNLRTTQNNAWRRAYIAKNATVLTQTPSWLRSRDENLVFHNFSIRSDGVYPETKSKYFENGGWHLSYFMNPKEIAHKIESFSHTEYDTEEIKDLDRIKKCIEEKTDLFNRTPLICNEFEFSTQLSSEFLSAFERWRD